MYNDFTLNKEEIFSMWNSFIQDSLLSIFASFAFKFDNIYSNTAKKDFWHFAGKLQMFHVILIASEFE